MTMVSPTEVGSAAVSISALAGCSGLELVARLAEGSIRRAPMAETLPFTVVSRGRTVITLEARMEDAQAGSTPMARRHACS